MTWDTPSKSGWLVGIGAIIIVSLVGGALYVQNRRASLSNLSKPRVAPASMPAEFKAQKEQEALEKVKRLRELWRDHWASGHKSLLIAMMNGRDGDDSAWINVTTQIPPPSKKRLGFDINTPQEQNPNNIGNPDYVVAGWNPGWPIKPARPELAEQAKRISDAQKITFQQSMAQWHDIKLLQVSSIAADRSCCLWVSGRVTWQIKTPPRPGAMAAPTSEEPVMPPYEFLTQK